MQKPGEYLKDHPVKYHGKQVLANGKQWASRWCKRVGFPLRKPRTKCALSGHAERVGMTRHLSTYRAWCLGGGKPGAAPPEWPDRYGKYPLARRYNMDETGVCLESNSDRTVATPGEVRDKAITVRVPGGSSSGKRFATVMMLMNAADDRLPQAVLFKGDLVLVVIYTNKACSLH